MKTNLFPLVLLLASGPVLTSGSLLLAADVAAGKAAYEASCAKCHGADGTPKPAIAKMLKVEMRHLGSKEVQAKSDAELKKETLEGVGKMKAVPAAEKDIANILAFVRTLKQ